MNLVTITGPHGADKDNVIKEVIKRIQADNQDNVKRALFLTTRKVTPEETPGIDVLLASEKDFNDLLEQGELSNPMQVEDYLDGPQWEELEKCNNLLVSITLDGAKILKEKFKKKGARVFMIALAKNGGNGQNNSEFDLVVYNAEGDSEGAINKILNAAKKFFSLPSEL